jgi:hypothetical protein
MTATATLIMTLLMAATHATAQQYRLHREHDSLYWLNEWRLPYPVDQFQTGDVNGDGSEDALVRVVKATRFDPHMRRRLFVFKQVGGKVRPLWLGSRLGGTLCNFRFDDGRVRSLETTADSLYVVADYRWEGFGLQFERYLAKGVDRATADSLFAE